MTSPAIERGRAVLGTAVADAMGCATPGRDLDMSLLSLALPTGATALAVGAVAAVAVMGLAVIGEVEQHRVVEHRAVSFRDTLQSTDDGVDYRHVLVSNLFSNVCCFEIPDRLSVSDVMLIDVLTLDARQTCVVGAEFIHGERDHVRHSRDQC